LTPGHHVCGGAIYKTDRIVTSRRCCQKMDISHTSEVVAGDVTPFDGVVKASTQRRNISSILLHSDEKSEPTLSDVESLPTSFPSSMFGDDVCVLTLETAFHTDGEFVDVIDVSEDKNQPEVGATCQGRIQ